MKKIATGLAVVLCLNASGQQVEFTAAEGYKSKALNGQNGWDASPGWMVDATGGTVSATKVFQKAVLTGKPVFVPPGGTVLVRVAFQLNGTPTVPSGGNTPVLATGLKVAGSDEIKPNRASQTVLMLAMTGTMQLRNNNNSGGLVPAATLSIAGNAQARLAIEYRLALGATAAESTFSAKLINLASGSESPAGSYTGVSQQVFEAATSVGVVPYFAAQTFDGNGSGVSGVTVDFIRVSPEFTLIVG
jgi:hypothetical protein